MALSVSTLTILIVFDCNISILDPYPAYLYLTNSPPNTGGSGSPPLKPSKTHTLCFVCHAWPIRSGDPRTQLPGPMGGMGGRFLGAGVGDRWTCSARQLTVGVLLGLCWGVGNDVW